MASSLTEVNEREILCHTELLSIIDSRPPVPREDTWMALMLEYILTIRAKEIHERCYGDHLGYDFSRKSITGRILVAYYEVRLNPSIPIM